MIFLIQNYQDFLLADFYLPFGRSFAYYLPNGRSVRYVSSIVVVPETQNCTAFVRGGAKLYGICPILVNDLRVLFFSFFVVFSALCFWCGIKPDPNAPKELDSTSRPV